MRIVGKSKLIGAMGNDFLEKLGREAKRLFLTPFYSLTEEGYN